MFLAKLPKQQLDPRMTTKSFPVFYCYYLELGIEKYFRQLVHNKKRTEI